MGATTRTGARQSRPTTRRRQSASASLPTPRRTGADLVLSLAGKPKRTPPTHRHHWPARYPTHSRISSFHDNAWVRQQNMAFSKSPTMAKTAAVIRAGNPSMSAKALITGAKIESIRRCVSPPKNRPAVPKRGKNTGSRRPREQHKAHQHTKHSPWYATRSAASTARLAIAEGASVSSTSSPRHCSR